MRKKACACLAQYAVEHDVMACAMSDVSFFV